MWTAIVASVAVLMLLFGDFGGYYYSNYYGRVEVYGHVYLGSGLLATILILMGVGGLLVALQSALKALKEKESSAGALKQEIQRGIRGAGFTAALAALGAVALIAGNLENEWWLDTGFFGAFFGGLLVIFFGKQIIRAVEE